MAQKQQLTSEQPIKRRGIARSLNPIKTSFFDLYKIGPGPSSSHTIGPMKAARHFLHELRRLDSQAKKRASSLQIFLFGSLSATGKGHGTDRALVAGLLDWTPDALDPDFFRSLLAEDSDSYPIDLHGAEVSFEDADIHFEAINHDYPFSNTIIMQLRDKDERILKSREFYSVGGGFIQWKGMKEPEVDPPPYPYQNMTELLQQLDDNDIELYDLLLANEQSISGESVRTIHSRLDRILDTMEQAVERGLNSKGVLPGTIGMNRKAPNLYHRARYQAHTEDQHLVYLNAFCMAASEENAAGNIVVTAPTSGASGVIPGLIYLLMHHHHIKRHKLREGLIVAAAIGFLVKHNASISGAEAGCMGEVGTASAMGAAMVAYLYNAGIRCIQAAAEIALEHHLGMTCDPVGGYVQIPCIERNAVGGVKAYNAYLLASSGIPEQQKVSLDNVIEVMRETGRDMSRKYKETSEGGLALSVTEC